MKSYLFLQSNVWWLGGLVVSVLDSGGVGSDRSLDAVR